MRRRRAGSGYLVLPHIAGTKFSWTGSRPLHRSACRRALEAVVLALGGLAARGQRARVGGNVDVRWALREKRQTAVRVVLPGAAAGGRDAGLVRRILRDGPVNRCELVNQCATMTRMIDALAWAEAHIRSYTEVIACHPTQSSAKALFPKTPDSGTDDNDLVLRRPDGSVARFEVFDDAGGGGNNGKIEGGLRRLGVKRATTGRAKSGLLRFNKPCDFARGERYLVVSEETAKRVAKHRTYSDLLVPEPADGTAKFATFLLRLNQEFGWAS